MGKSEVQSFSCQNCGTPYKAHPPDSSFEHAYITPCTETEDLEPNHNYKQGYDCQNESCGHRNFLYWCQGHTYIAVAGGSGDRDDDPFGKRAMRSRLGSDSDLF